MIQELKCWLGKHDPWPTHHRKEKRDGKVVYYSVTDCCRWCGKHCGTRIIVDKREQL